MEKRTARLTILIDPRKKKIFEEICASQAESLCTRYSRRPKLLCFRSACLTCRFTSAWMDCLRFS